MAHSFAEERERIFNVLASNLNAFFPEAQNTVVCPLCRSAHGRDSLLGDGLELTREHCIPASAGGKLVTLTCRACNNSHGISSDSHLKNLLLAEDAVEGIGGTVDGTISIEGHPFRCEVGFGREGEKSLHFTPIVKASNSKERDTAFAIVEASSNTGDDFSANLELRFRYCPFRSNLVLVKAAYLLMFKQFGYSYMSSKAQNSSPTDPGTRCEYRRRCLRTQAASRPGPPGEPGSHRHVAGASAMLRPPDPGPHDASNTDQVCDPTRVR